MEWYEVEREGRLRGAGAQTGKSRGRWQGAGRVIRPNPVEMGAQAPDSIVG